MNQNEQMQGIITQIINLKNNAVMISDKYSNTLSFMEYGNEIGRIYKTYRGTIQIEILNNVCSIDIDEFLDILGLSINKPIKKWRKNETKI